MGRAVSLWKLEETHEKVVYLYGETKEKAARIWLDKATGQIGGEHVSGMTEQHSSFFYGSLAKAWLEQMFKKGSYPETGGKVT